MPVPVTSAAGPTAREPMQAPTGPNVATPPYEPPAPLALNDSGRRILWIVGLYRAICGAVLLGTALLLDLKVLGIVAPNTFVSAAGVYFVYGLVAFWWIQLEPVSVPAPA